jgi:hypothetical protein
VAKVPVLEFKWFRTCRTSWCDFLSTPFRLIYAAAAPRSPSSVAVPAVEFQASAPVPHFSLPDHHGKSLLAWGSPAPHANERCRSAPPTGR